MESFSCALTNENLDLEEIIFKGEVCLSKNSANRNLHGHTSC